jgi:hypothetical protein
LQQLTHHSQVWKHCTKFFDDRVISHGMWPPHSPDLTNSLWLLFVNAQKIKCIKQIHTLWKNQEATPTVRFQQFPWKNCRQLIPTCSSSTLSAFDQKGNTFRMCWNMAEFFLHFPKVVLIHQLTVEIYVTRLPSLTATCA